MTNTHPPVRRPRNPLRIILKPKALNGLRGLVCRGNATARTTCVPLCLLAGLAACSSTGAHYETSKTHPDGSVETRRAGYQTVRVREDAPQAVGELLNVASPFLPPWVMPAASSVLGALGFDLLRRPLRQRREDRLYDEAYDRGRADKSSKP